MKNMGKKFLLGTIVGNLIASPFVAMAQFTCPSEVPPAAPMTQPYMTTDTVRSVAGLVAGVIALSGGGEAKAQLIATQEENNKKASGQSGSAGSTDTSQGQLNPSSSSGKSTQDTLGSAAESEFSGSAFDYVDANLLATEGGIKYSPLKEALASASDGDSVRGNIRTAVLREFFADPTKEEQTTTTYKEKIRQQRDAYVQDAANRHVTLGYRVKGLIQGDLAVISSAAVSGDGELGSIAVDSHTLEQMVKMELVDLALQIEMMEADAVHFLMNQPIDLMSQTKPAS